MRFRISRDRIELNPLARRPRFESYNEARSPVFVVTTSSPITARGVASAEGAVAQTPEAVPLHLTDTVAQRRVASEVVVVVFVFSCNVLLMYVGAQHVYTI